MGAFSILLLGALSSSAFAAPAAPSPPAPMASLISPGTSSIQIPGKYIVKMKDGCGKADLKGKLGKIKAKADHIYDDDSSYMGFAATLSNQELNTLLGDKLTDYVEKVVQVKTQTTQPNADWGLARLSNTKPGSNIYTYDASAGVGTCAFVLDTGIDVTHTDFGGRATWLANFAGDGIDQDGNGHGTHVAGILGSTTFGVAKRTKLFAVKVADASGITTSANVIAGMNYIAANGSAQYCPKGSVVNISLGAPNSAALNQAAAAMVSAGYFVAAAAGNYAQDASFTSPASEPTVCTVGATDSKDAFASYSNFGKSVDILAPGTSITSLWPGQMVNTLSGTSMATPHIAGLAAYALSLTSRNKLLIAPKTIGALISQLGQANVVSSVPSLTANILGHNSQ